MLPSSLVASVLVEAKRLRAFDDRGDALKSMLALSAVAAAEEEAFDDSAFVATEGAEGLLVRLTLGAEKF